jgi:hypothetical protein
MSSGISFWASNQVARASAAEANERLFSDKTAYKLFTKGNPSASTTPSVLTEPDPYAVINPIGQAFLTQSMSAAVLAAQAGKDRVDQASITALNGTATKPIGDFSSQLTWSAALKVDFGNDGPAPGGGYRFLSGKALQDAFKIAVGAKKSDGEAIDTVSVFGDTLTGSTSGENAHDVFTLKLNRNSGIFEFNLIAPIDQSNKKGSYNSVYLRSLMEAVSASGQKMQLPTIEIDIYNDYGQADGKGPWGILHEASLTYKDPNAVSSTSTSETTTTEATTYTPPTDSRTLRGYTSNTSAAKGVINSVNIFS